MEKGLGYWKGAYLTMKALYDAAIRTARMYALAMERAKREVDSRERQAKIITVILLGLMVGGCNTLHGVLKDGEWLLSQGAENTQVEQGRE